ncbi:hypothetical protein TraAM80_09024 [Trypanosoma rangeli]|uniref:Uncharacterized protein n=1 Tax=Trypanosoma rangeli TaxID=5698 RepID=A0A3R7N0H7_TRYRA|nr:uncharacterized protein TraAM80_09024 [Trypanosoma rangeli]RNE98000.1 hypothetical protein TraAM80_09024 [Trypanosoma rangeli]|eukprot:RNE98000.1 hypothetical protein TraAM80_09024 [Trypanosoma rangeli]
MGRHRQARAAKVPAYVGPKTQALVIFSVFYPCCSQVTEGGRARALPARKGKGNYGTAQRFGVAPLHAAHAHAKLKKSRERQMEEVDARPIRSFAATGVTDRQRHRPSNNPTWVASAHRCRGVTSLLLCVKRFRT